MSAQPVISDDERERYRLEIAAVTALVAVRALATQPGEKFLEDFARACIDQAREQAGPELVESAEESFRQVRQMWVGGWRPE